MVESNSNGSKGWDGKRCGVKKKKRKGKKIRRRSSRWCIAGPEPKRETAKKRKQRQRAGALFLLSSMRAMAQTGRNSSFLNMHQRQQPTYGKSLEDTSGKLLMKIPQGAVFRFRGVWRENTAIIRLIIVGEEARFCGCYCEW